MLTKLSLTTLIAAVLLAGGLMLAAPEQGLDAGQCVDCSLGSPTTTPEVEALSQDCPWAVKDAKMQLEAMANCTDGYCVKQFITTQACQEVLPNLYRVRMKLTYQCEECLQFPGL